MCRCSWNVATDKWKVHNGEIEIISFVVQGLLKKKPKEASPIL
jgi:hypothetical protein